MKVRHTAIFENLRREILAGKFDSERKLPSECALARRFSVSRPTISRVMLDLKREGLVVTRPGAATVLSRFALNATGALGLIDPGNGQGNVLSTICRHIVRFAEQAGWDVIREVVEATDPVARAREIEGLAARFSSEHVSGVFIQPLEYLTDNASASNDVVTHLDLAKIPVVLLDYDIVSPPARSRYDLVAIDNLAAGLAVGHRLLASGSGKLAFLMPCGSPATVEDRCRGVACSVIKHGGVWTEKGNLLRATPENARAVSRFVRVNGPDAIVCGNDALAVRLRETLERLGLAGSIRLAGFDGLSDVAWDGYVTVRQPCEDMAAVAFHTLVSRIKNPRLPARTIVLPATVIER